MFLIPGESDLVESFVSAKGRIDPYKVNTAILSGVQNYWGECAAKHKLQMAD